MQSFVGPAFNYAMAAQMTIVIELCDPDIVERVQGVRPRKSMWIISNGALEKYNLDCPERAFNFQKYVSMDCNYLSTLVGEEYEDVLRKQPDLPAAKYYRRFIRRLTVENWNPLHDLIMKYSQSLDERPSPHDFKEKFGKVVKSPLLRNFLYLNFLLFVEEMRDVLRAWDAGDYTRMFPESHPLPTQLFRYFVGQITTLRNKEIEMGAVQHELLRDDTVGKGSILDETLTRIEQQKKEAIKTSKEEGAGSKKTQKTSKKYVVAASAVTSAVISGAATAAVG